MLTVNKNTKEQCPRLGKQYSVITAYIKQVFGIKLLHSCKTSKQH